jgi:hypothetical protein
MSISGKSLPDLVRLDGRRVEVNLFRQLFRSGLTVSTIVA